MKSDQNKMNNSSCSTCGGEMVRNSTRNSKIDSTENWSDLKEIRNQGDMREVTDRGGNKGRNDMTNS